MKKTIGIILILAAIFFGYMGFSKMDESSAEVSIGDLELSAEDEGGKQTSYVYYGLCALCLIGGIVMTTRKS